MDGIGVPSLAWCRMLREVPKPAAPASMACLTMARMAARSASVAGSRRIARSPITNTRSGECGSRTAKSMSWGLRSTASRKSGKLSQFHGRPSAMTTSGMSSTPSISLTRLSRSASRQGAKPTPQLPVTTVVTPWLDEGVRVSDQVSWPS